jgi:hypothetical protein
MAIVRSSRTLPRRAVDEEGDEKPQHRPGHASPDRPAKRRDDIGIGSPLLVDDAECRRDEETDEGKSSHAPLAGH